MRIKEIKLKSFKKWSPSFKFLFFPMLILGLLALSAFILTSFWKYDWLSAEFFGRGIKYTAVKYWTQYNLDGGATALIVPFVIFIMILLESLFKKQIEKKSNGFYSKNRWIVITIYLLIFVAWLAYNIYRIVEYNWKDAGFGPGRDKWTLDSTQINQTMKIVSFLIQTTLLFGGSYYVHYKLVNQKQFWKQEYWIDAIKGITFFAISFFLVAFLKGMLSRFYYYNCNFGDILAQLRAEGKGDWVDNYVSQAPNGFKYGFNNGNNLWDANIPGEWPWYKPNGYFKSQPEMPQFPFFISYAFPSGHVNATYCFGSIFFLVLGKDRKLNWVVKLLLGIFLLYLLSMTFSLVTMRGHWISDLSFSHVWALLLFPIINLTVNQIVQKSREKRKIKTQ